MHVPVFLSGSRNKAICGPWSFQESLKPSSFTLSQEISFITRNIYLSCPLSCPGNCAGSQANYRFSVDYLQHVFYLSSQIWPICHHRRAWTAWFCHVHWAALMLFLPSAVCNKDRHPFNVVLSAFASQHLSFYFSFVLSQAVFLFCFSFWHSSQGCPMLKCTALVVHLDSQFGGTGRGVIQI